MFLNVLIYIFIAWCTVKTVGYGVYTLRNNNKTGGISILVLAAAVATSAFMFI